jgi:uncharacterized protein
MATTSHRYDAMDLLRGFALLGIFQINIIYFALPHELYNLPTLKGTHDLYNALSWFFTTLLVDGSMYGLFSLLFGASAALMLERLSFDPAANPAAEPAALQLIDHYYRRMLWLILFGLLHAYLLLSPMEILYAYGVLGLFLFPLRNLSAAALSGFGLFLLFFGVVDFVVISDAEASIPLESRPIILSSILSGHIMLEADYLPIFLENFAQSLSWQSVNFIEDQVFDAGGMMLLGMAAYKLGIVTGARSVRFYLLLSLAGYLAAMLLRWPSSILLYESGFDPSVFNELPTGVMLIGRIFLVFGHLGLLLTVYRLRLLRTLCYALQQTGRMALTHYILQTLFSVYLFYGFALALYGRFERYELLLIALLFSLLQMAMSIAWLHHFYYGPLEWVWRSLVRLQPQPMRKRGGSAAARLVEPVAVGVVSRERD